MNPCTVIFFVSLLFITLIVLFILLWNTWYVVQLVPTKNFGHIGSGVLPASDGFCQPLNCWNDNFTLQIHIYKISWPDDNFKQLSSEMREVIRTIKDSRYFTANPSAACLFTPIIDVLNPDAVSLQALSSTLRISRFWRHGCNNVLWSFLLTTYPNYNTRIELATDDTIVAGASFATWNYRLNMDVSLPMFNPLTSKTETPIFRPLDPFLLISAHLKIPVHIRATLYNTIQKRKPRPHVLILERCTGDAPDVFYERCDLSGQRFSYPLILSKGTFCLVTFGKRLGHTMLYDVMKFGCIPVIAVDDLVLPFESVLDWHRAAIRIPESQIENLFERLSRISPQKILEFQSQVSMFFHRYMETVEKITLTAMHILNDRIYPITASSYEDWNWLPNQSTVKNPLANIESPPKLEGFTAVILTYNRLQSLFEVIQRLDQCPSLSKIVVVWNNPLQTPPPESELPKISVPLVLLRQKINSLNNRFLPFGEIETESVLSIDDDIVMLKADEIEFAYQAWREFPDRLVGFPSRVHVWNNISSQWSYESEWLSNLSIVLTGAAFYHKYFHHLYWQPTFREIRQFVDHHMNCEDIAMNFLVLNSTGNSPIKILPRKKFRCPQCSSSDMSANSQYYIQRSFCLHHFVKKFTVHDQHLKTVEFRADPLLLRRTDVPDSVNLFRQVDFL